MIQRNPLELFIGKDSCSTQCADQFFAVDKECLVVVLRDHTVVVRKLAFDELGEEVNIAEHEAGLRLANFNQNFGVGIRQQLHELLNGLARKDGFDAAVKLDF